ncbi:subtilisin inhibitor-like [Haloactinospora alba]|uniref:Subtilisin inhibitor-like n=2 Tax=Haloactinospora alba TaxID=405555 RepID=A0A543N9Z2_9ACTN|nr:subtilisin inhibitor-like [Haloactinospora alba]
MAPLALALSATAACAGGEPASPASDDSVSPTHSTTEPSPSTSDSPTAPAPTDDTTSSAGDGTPPTDAPDDPETRLTITVTGGDRSGAEWTLTCGPAGGDHPDSAAACEELAELSPEAFAEVPEDQPCTHIHGGPEAAEVSGTMDGTEIDTEFNKSGGCEMERYENLGPVLEP